MKVSELGEFGLINLLAEMVGASFDKRAASFRQLLIGIGDDAAAWHGDTSTQLATVDALIQDVHFTFETTPWYDLGWKSMAVNLSDIAAMGGSPRYALVTLALPGYTEVEDATALYKGMLELAQQFGVVIAGGDITKAPLVVVTVTVLGSAGGHVLTRSAAEVGDQIAVTGYLGAATAGLRMLTKRLQFDPETTDCLRQAFLCPSPRIAEGQLLVEHGMKAAIDISDGLIADLRHICEASRVSARVEVDRVPIHPAVAASFGDEALELALSGGEDYELLFTGSAEIIKKVRKATACPITVIGEIVAGRPGEVVLVDSEGKALELGKTGWEHFQRDEPA